MTTDLPIVIIAIVAVTLAIVAYLIWRDRDLH